MRPTTRHVALAASVLVLSVAMSGCLTVYPAKALFTGEGAGESVPMQVVVAYEQMHTASNPQDGGSETRTVFVPTGSDRVTIDVYAKLTSLPPWADQFDTRHFDFTVTDGAGTAWADIHLRNNSTTKTIHVDGPRTGGWTVTLNYNLQGNIPGLPADQFRVQVLVSQPAG